MQSILTIKNEGAAPAVNIALKFSHPNFILSYIPKDGENDRNSANILNLVPFYGQSCTVLKLNKNGITDENENLIIFPGEEARYGLYLKMAELGDHTVSILLEYRRE